jgi:hypothetical protein
MSHARALYSLHVIFPQPFAMSAAGFVLPAQYAHCPTSIGVVLDATVVELGGTVDVGADVVAGVGVEPVVDSDVLAGSVVVLETSTGCQ